MTRRTDIGFVAAALLVGAFVRLWHLGAQVMGGDELHLVRAVLGSDLRTLLTTFGEADASIPLCAGVRLLLAAGLPMSEASLRAPSLLAGLALVALFPWLLARRAPAEVARAVSLPLLAGLVALAPPLVLYSRIVRSYSILVLLCAVAAVSFYRFWTTGSRRAAGGYVAAAALALWFHLGAGPFIAAPFLFALGDWLHGPARDRRRLAALGWCGLGLLAASALLLGPATPSLAALVETRRAPLAMTAATLRTVAALQAGVGSPLAASAFWLVTAGGFVHLARRAPRFAFFTLTLVLGHGAGLALLSPVTIENPLVLNRYLLPLAPWLLVWFAAGVSALAAALPPILGRAVLVAAPLAWLASGPLVEPRFRASSFAHHNLAMLYTEPWEMRRDELPPLYRELLRRSRPGDRFAEYPFADRWYAFEEIPRLQLAHRRDVVVVGNQGWLSRRGARLRNAVRARPETVLASGARFLVVHHAVDEPGDSPARRFLDALGAAWGRPSWVEKGVAPLSVWDLDAVRDSPLDPGGGRP